MKPILSKINVFSATEDAVFQFGAYADIDLVAFIVFKSSDSTVYKFGTVAPTGTGLARQFVIKANVLQNQHDPYYIMIRCRLTGTNTFSEYSDKVLFYCHEKPSISFTAFSKHTGIFGIIFGNKSDITLTTPSYNFDCRYTYKTAEGEVLNRYEYYLYDANKELVQKSQCLYHRDSMKSFHVDGLDNNATYYIRAKAESVGGYQLDTGYKEFKTKYSEQSEGTLITAKNNKYEGSISLYAHCPSTVDSGITHVRFKRRKAGGLNWMTIYEKTIDMDTDLLILPEWSNGFVSQTGVSVSDKLAQTTEFIETANMKGVEISKKGYTARISAYDANKKFLGYYDTKVHLSLIPGAVLSGSSTKFKMTKGVWTKESWNADYKANVAYYRVSIIPDNDVNVKFDNSAYDLKIHAEKSGSLILEHTDWYAEGRRREYEYAVAPVINTMEQGYVKTSVVSDFDGAIITNGDISYHITLEPTVESIELARTASIVETLGNKYPFLYFGNEANYYMGDFSGVGIEWNKEDDSFDVDGGNDYRKKLSSWLTNGDAKVLKMSDGREWLIGVNGNVKITCADHIDKAVLEFSFVEIGDIESEDDMYSNGLSEFMPVGGTA